MPALSGYLENALIKHCFKGVAYTAPSPVYVALFTTSPGGSFGTGGVELNPSSATGYARQALTTASSGNSFTTVGTIGTTAGSMVGNNVATSWTAGADWATGSTYITAAGLFDSGTYGAGNLLWFAPLVAQQQVANGATFTFSAATVSTDPTTATLRFSFD